MGLSHVLISLVLLCTVLVNVNALFQQAKSAAKTGSDAAKAPLNVADKYFLTNFYALHFDCYRWCWLVIGKEKRQACRETMKSRCQELKDYSYKRFIVFQLTKVGLGKGASKILRVPGETLNTGVKVGAATVETVSRGIAVEGAKVGTAAVGTVSRGIAVEGAKVGTAAVGAVSRGIAVEGAKGAASLGAGAADTAKAGAGVADAAASTGASTAVKVTSTVAVSAGTAAGSAKEGVGTAVGVAGKTAGRLARVTSFS